MQCPQQTTNVECGYYVIRFMKEIIESQDDSIKKCGSHFLILLKFIDFITLMHVLILTILCMIYSLLDETAAH